MNSSHRPCAPLPPRSAPLSTGAAQAQANAYPSKPIKWVVPFPPAGAMDTIARTLGEQMGRKLGQTFVIENRPGAGGNIGADAVAKAAPDGYTMMIVANGMAVNKFLYGKLSYDPVKNFAPVVAASRSYPTCWSPTSRSRRRSPWPT